MRVLPQRTIDALGLQVEVRGQPAKWSGRVARETTPARKRRTTRPFVPCRRRHERSYRHALPSPGVCPPGVPLSELGLVTGPDSRDFPGPQASWPQRALGRSTGPDRGTPIASEPTPAFGAGYGVSASPGGLSQRTTSSRPPARDRLPPRSYIRRKQQSRRRYRLLASEQPRSRPTCRRPRYRYRLLPIARSRRSALSHCATDESQVLAGRIVAELERSARGSGLTSTRSCPLDRVRSGPVGMVCPYFGEPGPHRLAGVAVAG
jgi:hypothetical protein